MKLPRHSNLSLDEVETYFNCFAESLISPYLTRIKKENIAFSNKEINDPISGTITLSDFEVALLDCPLLQRLRNIKQLGVVHWIYPGANHTRFEHSLGVLARAQQIIDAINQTQIRGSSPNNYRIDQRVIRLLRTSALLHDVGHGNFSHVSESALMSFSEYQFVCQEFGQKYQTDNTKLSEMSSYYMIRSPAMREYLRYVGSVTEGQPVVAEKGQDNADLVVRKISDMIIGKPIYDEYPIIQEIISGAFDADKLDYLSRDAQSCGIPNIIDISRLLKKIDQRSAPQSKLPRAISERVTGGLDSYRIFGIKTSGAQVLDELAMARAFLHAKVYRHSKVQAIEAMVGSLYRAVAKTCGREKLLSFAYEFEDAEVIRLHKSDVPITLSSRGIPVIDDEFLPVIQSFARRLDERRLFSKVFQFQIAFKNDPNGESSKQKRGLKRLQTALKAVGDSTDVSLEAIKDNIVKECRRIIELLPSRFVSYDGDLDFDISIVPPPERSGYPDIGRVLIFHPDGEIESYADSPFNSDGWSSAYEGRGAAAGFAFAPSPILSAVYIAIERVIYDLFDILCPDSAKQLSKVDTASLSRLKNDLLEVGYYEDMPIDIRPMPERLTKADIEKRVGAIANKLRSYHQPIDVSDFEIFGGIEEKVIYWLRQFGRSSDIELAIQTLERLKVLGRQDVVTAAKEFFERNPDFVGASIVGFGSLKDSGSIVSYFANDLGPSFHSGVMSLEDAMSVAPDKPVVFFDDLIASGGQAADMIARWFDVDELKEDLGERRIPFEEPKRKFLRSRKVAFLFVCGWKDGVKKLERAAKTAGLDAVVHAHLGEPDLPFLFDEGVLKGKKDDIIRFRKFCEDVGRSVSLSNTKDKVKTKNRILGYGNRAMLLCFPYNVPTQTLTIIREDGVYNGMEWKALLVRRKKN